MKKILCGALVLLAAVAAFTSCKKKDNNGEAVSSLILSATEVTMSPGDDAKKITVKTNTGTVVTYEWSTDDADNAVITLSAKGSTATITPVGFGTAVVTVKVKGNETLTAECIINVIDKVQNLRFSRLSVNYAEPPANIDSTKVYDYSYLPDGNKITGKKDTIRCYLGDIRLRLLADGETFVDNDGYLTAKTESGAYTIEAIGRVPVIARNINAAFFDAAMQVTESEAAKQAWANPSYYEIGTIASNYNPWIGDNKEEMYHLTTGSVNEAQYVELLGKAFVEHYPENAQTLDDMEDFFNHRDIALAEIKGAYLAQWLYDPQEGIWYQSAFRAGIVPTLSFHITTNTHTEEVGYKYTYVIDLANIKFRPFGGYENYGIDLKLDKLTKKYEMNSNDFQWNPTVDCSFDDTEN